MAKLVKYPRKPKRVEIDRYVLQSWDEEWKEWRDVPIYYTGWPGGKAATLNKDGKLVRIISRRGKVTETVERYWGPQGIERRLGERY